MVYKKLLLFLLLFGTWVPLEESTIGWTGVEGTSGFFPSFFFTMGKTIFLQIYTFQAIQRRFYPYDLFFNFEKIPDPISKFFKYIYSNKS
jgi:hypothetical protein